MLGLFRQGEADQASFENVRTC